MGAGKTSDSLQELAALPRGLSEGNHPLSLGGLPARRGLCWKDVMWQGTQPQAGAGLRTVRQSRGRQGWREVEKESKRLWQHQHQQPGEEAALGWRFCQWWAGARGCPVPGRGNQDSSFLQGSFAHSSFLMRFWGWAAGAVAIITGTGVGGPSCISLPAVAKFHQCPGAGPAALPSCGRCPITQSPADVGRQRGKGGKRQAFCQQQGLNWPK